MDPVTIRGPGEDTWGGLDVSVLHIQTKTMLNAHTLSMCKYAYKCLACTFVSINCVTQNMLDSFLGHSHINVTPQQIKQMGTEFKMS